MNSIQREHRFIAEYQRHGAYYQQHDETSVADTLEAAQQYIYGYYCGETVVGGCGTGGQTRISPMVDVWIYCIGNWKNIDVADRLYPLVSGRTWYRIVVNINFWRKLFYATLHMYVCVCVHRYINIYIYIYLYV